MWYVFNEKSQSWKLQFEKEQLSLEKDHRQMPAAFVKNLSSLLPKDLPSYSSQNTTTTNTVTSATVNNGQTITDFDISKPSSTTAGDASELTSSAGTTSNTPTTRQHVTVQQMEHLYDSHMIVSQGIKLQWIRNRMMT